MRPQKNTWSSWIARLISLVAFGFCIFPIGIIPGYSPEAAQSSNRNFFEDLESAVEECPAGEKIIGRSFHLTQNGVYFRSLDQHETDPYHDLLLLVLAVGASLGIIIILLGVYSIRLRRARRDLRASRQRYQEMANLLPLAVFESDERGSLVFANQRAFQIFGYPENQLELGINVEEMTAPQDRERVRESIALALKDGNWEGNFTAQRQDGGTFPVQVRVTTREQDGRTIGLRGVVIDLTNQKETEEQLRSSEQRFRNIIEANPIGMHIYQLEGEDRLVFAGANPAADNILGIDHRKLVGKTIQEAFPGINETPMPEVYLRIARDGGYWHEEQINYRDKRISGAFDVHVFQVGEGVSAGMFLEITDRIRAAQAVRDGMERFESVINNTPAVAIQGFDREGVIRHWNRASQRIYGFSEQDALGKHIQDLMFTPETRGAFDKILEEIWQSGKPTQPREWQVTNDKGEERWVYSTVFPIFEQGEISEAFCMDVDITDRQIAEEELRNSEQRYRALFEKAYDAIFLETLDDKIVDANQRACELVGYTLEELKKMDVKELLLPDHPFPVVLEELKMYQGRVFEGVDRHKSGKHIPVEVSTTLINENLAISIVRDITERKHNEELLRKLNRSLRTISECNQILVRAVDENDLLDKICAMIHQNSGYRFVWVGYATPDHTIRPASYAGYEAGYLKKTRFLWGNKEDISNPMAKAIHTVEQVMVPDLGATELEKADWAVEAHKRGCAAILALPLFYDQEVFGTLGIYTSEQDAFDPDEIVLLKELADDLSYGIHALRVRADNRRANELLKRSAVELERAYDATLEGWSRALELRERETAGHSRRVVDLALRLGKQLGMDRNELLHLRRGALLHDIGKMGIPDHVLLKPGPLTAEEWEIMRQHPTYAYQLLTGISYLEQALQVPYGHHERWDGSGYPLGLKGEAIPLAARIFAVVDVWDALSSDRPYRSAWSSQEVYDYLKANAGILFDAQIVQEFIKIIQTGKEML